MAKVKSVFFCNNCGQESPKWLGKCPSCSEWNTFVEERLVKTKSGSHKKQASEYSKSVSLAQIQSENQPRITTPIEELNRVLGGGLVAGSVTLLGGEPGIGKSTLSLQLALLLDQKRILYISGEESATQVKMRAERLGGYNENCLIFTETEMSRIENELQDISPDIIFVDSIQTLYAEYMESTAGSISQIRECTGSLLKYAKSNSVPVILIGHITKDGSIAGPKILEHMVDTVLQFEGDRNHVFRILRATKNRFGSTQELGIFEMNLDGLKEVLNPSDILITHQQQSLSGISIAASLEGLRPLLIETQALVSSAVYGTPQRSSTGFDLRRLNMLLAVLEKRCGFRLGAKDVFLNMAGGLRVEDPAIDLAVVIAILSSSEDISIEPQNCFAAEIGLSGELRPVSRLGQRISEAEKLGFKRIFVSEFGMKGIAPKDYKIEIISIGKIEEVVTYLFA